LRGGGGEIKRLPSNTGEISLQERFWGLCVIASEKMKNLI